MGPRVLQSCPRPRRTTAAVLVPPGVVSTCSSRRPADLHRLIQHGVRSERSAPQLIGRTGQRRPGTTSRPRAISASRWWARTAPSAGIFPPEHGRRWRPAGAVPLQRPWPAVRHTGTRERRRVGSADDRIAGPHALAAAWQAQVGRVTLYPLDRIAGSEAGGKVALDLVARWILDAEGARITNHLTN